MLKSGKKGFTLIELLVVIAIIGLLASIILVSLNNARAKARDARRLSDWHQIALALELYADANSGYYPSVTTVGCSVANWTNILSPALVTTYMSTLPRDPSNSGNYQYQYGSNATSNATHYVLRGRLERVAAPGSPDIDNNPAPGITGCNCTDPWYCNYQ